METLIEQLFEVDAVKFGNYVLKSGINSPIYFDLRVIVAHPNLMKDVAYAFSSMIEKDNLHCDTICGVPYTALPIATVVSIEKNIPMLVKRKEAKDYGTKKMIEGKFKSGDTCLIIEDVVTSGSSVLDTAESLRKEGIVVTDAIVLLNREQGGRAKLKLHGINLHSVIDVFSFVESLHKLNKISTDIKDSSVKFIKDNRLDAPKVAIPSDEVEWEKLKKLLIENEHYYVEKNDEKGIHIWDGNQFISISNTHSSEFDTVTKSAVSNEVHSANHHSNKIISHLERSKLCQNPITKRLLEIMHSKKTNLAFSADVTSCSKLLELAEEVGPHICILKTHIDILEDFNDDFILKLKNLASSHNFIIFEDRKFADIGNTVMNQFGGGIYKISQWADIINAHSISGDGIIAGLKLGRSDKNNACLLIAGMSSKGNLCNEYYKTETLQMAKNHKDFIMGFICQKKISDDPELLHLTPGIQMSLKNDALGQQYTTPREAIYNHQTDIVIVGRGISKSELGKPCVAAKHYQEEGYNAFQDLLKSQTE